MNRALIFWFQYDPYTDRAGPGGSGTPAMSRGSENIATWWLLGSMLTTIRVSVFQVPSWGRLSEPIRSTLRRPLRSHGPVGGGVSLGSGVGPLGGATVGSEVPVLADGGGVGKSLSSPVLKMPSTPASAWPS